MTQIPETENTPVIRTDFSDDAAWEALCAAIQEPRGLFKAYVNFISNPAYDGMTMERLLSQLRGSNHTFIFIVDRAALTQPEHPILVVDLFEVSGRTFRVIPAELPGVECNLSLANMDFEEFADNVDPDGIFRGFSRP